MTRVQLSKLIQMTRQGWRNVGDDFGYHDDDDLGGDRPIGGKIKMQRDGQSVWVMPDGTVEEIVEGSA